MATECVVNIEDVSTLEDAIRVIITLQAENRSMKTELAKRKADEEPREFTKELSNAITDDMRSELNMLRKANERRKRESAMLEEKDRAKEEEEAKEHAKEEEEAKERAMDASYRDNAKMVLSFTSVVATLVFTLNFNARMIQRWNALPADGSTYTAVVMVHLFANSMIHAWLFGVLWQLLWPPALATVRTWPTFNNWPEKTITYAEPYRMTVWSLCTLPALATIVVWAFLYTA